MDQRRTVSASPNRRRVSREWAERGGSHRRLRLGDLIMRRGLVGGGRGSGRSLSLRHALIQRRNPPLQPINQFPLFRHSSVQLFNCLVLMGDADLKGV